ncbi:bifunctional folylpolyglutamate synthase/dihydrofolate synthase [Nocardia sp. NBC_00511]|uniref:bifunctional folylpolyglutamate synthase/dihydrofolate synthase n=1 Tax=Nocardia sp. NBC_00511 TaxID=2903591 RepID=UPI0030E2C5C9
MAKDQAADVEQYFSALSPSANTVVGVEGVGRMRSAELLARLGNPQDALRVIHVAGTAGKGSVSVLISAILAAHGWRVGTYLSPHVYSWFERFQLDGRLSSAMELAPAVAAVRTQEVELSAGPLGPVTMFEAATATAFEWFRDRQVEYAVIETGLGGLHDATNTVTRADKLAVLTRIGLDHTAILGETLQEIASQKAGILPVGGAAVAIRSGAQADRTIADVAAHRRCALDQLSDEQAQALCTDTVVGPAGPYQRINAGLALAGATHLARRDGWALNPAKTSAALREVRLPGRFERCRWQGHDLVLDGAHNRVKLAALTEAVGENWPGSKVVWVLLFKADKDVDDAMEVVAPTAAAVVATEYGTVGIDAGRGRGLPAIEVAAAARRAGIAPALTEPSLEKALNAAIALAGRSMPVIVSGSFYAVADAATVLAR